MTFSWDSRKAQSNRKKHHISFTEAMTVFDDPDTLVHNDQDFPDRQIAIGYSSEQRILFVVFIEIVDENWIRIISARKATRRERHLYEEGGDK